MIPLQDVVPSGRTPVITLALIALNVLIFAAQILAIPGATTVRPFVHTGLGPFLIGLLLLWLFGDNVEARTGRVTLLVLYLVAGFLSSLGATAAITAVLGAYFLLLPRSRVLVLVPYPLSLVEVPAAFFLGVWCVLHVAMFVRRPATMWAFAVALVVGAATARVMRRTVTW